MLRKITIVASRLFRGSTYTWCLPNQDLLVKIGGGGGGVDLQDGVYTVYIIYIYIYT